MSESTKVLIINEIVRRLWPLDHVSALALKRYMNETDYIKDIMLAVVKDIGYAMNELDLRDEKAVGFNRCKYTLARAVDEHNILTRDGYEQTFRPRLNCTIKRLEIVDDGNGGTAGGTEQDNEPMMEVTLRFSVREYNDSPHSLTPGKDNVYLMMKEL